MHARRSVVYISMVRPIACMKVHIGNFHQAASWKFNLLNMYGVSRDPVAKSTLYMINAIRTLIHTT